MEHIELQIKDLIETLNKMKAQPERVGFLTNVALNKGNTLLLEVEENKKQNKFSLLSFSNNIDQTDESLDIFMRKHGKYHAVYHVDSYDGTNAKEKQIGRFQGFFLSKEGAIVDPPIELLAIAKRYYTRVCSGGNIQWTIWF